MNLVLFDQHELRGNCLQLDGMERRSLHIRNILKLKPGDNVRLGMINGKIGQGQIIQIGPQVIEIDVTLVEELQYDRNLNLILALPRPIMLQRILKQATVLGVKTFHLIRSEKVQKSYFQSNVLEELSIRNLLLQGLEQAVDTRLPEVHVHHRFRPFVEDVVPKMSPGSFLLAHPEANLTLPDIYQKNGLEREVTLAIGPEGGWNDFEVQSFMNQGFAGFSFGSRILHVDTAVLVLLSQLMLLQDLPNR